MPHCSLAESDTEVGQLGSSLSWILLKGIVFGSANPNYGTDTSSSEPKPATIQVLCPALSIMDRSYSVSLMVSALKIVSYLPFKTVKIRTISFGVK